MENLPVEDLIALLYKPQCREQALKLLNKKRENRRLPLLLGNSWGMAFIAIEEILAVQRLLSPPILTMEEATRACNMISLIQCMACHPDVRAWMIQVRLPAYLYPLMNTTEQQLKQFEYIRLASMGVIATLLKIEDYWTPTVVHFLLEIDVFHSCLSCINVGGEVLIALAALVATKILMHEEGKNHCRASPELIFNAANSFCNVVDQHYGQPVGHDLLKHILSCYMRLYDVSRLIGTTHELSLLYPRRLRDPAYLNYACADPALRGFAYHVLQTICSGSNTMPLAFFVPPVVY